MRLLIWLLITVICMLLLTYGLLFYCYLYSVNVSQYLKLADDASTAQTKLEYLNKYKEATIKHIKRNEGRYVFKQNRLTRDVQLSIIDTLISRLNDMNKMDTKSFEYQQAMLQITGQEFDHTINEIDGVIHSCWLRQNSFAVFCLWFLWLIWVISCFICADWDYL